MEAELYTSELLDGLMAEISQAEQAKTDKKMQLAALIADEIKNKGLNKKEFAKALGKQPSVITKWLSGTHNFNADTLFDIEQVLGIKLFNLFETQKEQVITYNFKTTAKVDSVRRKADVSVHQLYSEESLATFRSKTMTM